MDKPRPLNTKIPDTVYVTKYAPTYGIIKREVIKKDGDCVIVRWPGWLNNEGCFCGDDWHKSEKAALARAEEMRSRKIASLRRQITKLEKLEFKVIDDA